MAAWLRLYTWSEDTPRDCTVYTAEMGRIWSDENKYRCWLRVEIAASQALARAGMVPQAAADAIRDKGAFTVERINQIEAAEVRHDVIAFTTTVAEHVGAGGALAALRPHLDRRGRYRAGAATGGGFGDHSCGHRTLARGVRSAGPRVQAHAGDWADARRACGADHVRAEAAALVRGGAAQPGAVRRCGRRAARRQAEAARLGRLGT